MAYKEMNYVIYIVVTMVIYWSEVFLAMLISDIGLIFEFISAFTISCTGFIFPGLFYLRAEEKFATSLQV